MLPLKRKNWVFLIADDTGMPKAGTHSVATAEASLPIKYRLYLPESWAGDATRRKAAGVPDTVEFMTKPQISLAQIQCAKAAGLPGDVVAAVGLSETDVARGNTSVTVRR